MTDDETWPDEYRIPVGTQPRSVAMHLALGTPTTGLWCDTCLLPSRYEVPLYVLSDDGPINVGVFDRCDGHQS